MSRIKEYIDNMMESGIDVLVTNPIYDEEYLERQRQNNINQMNEMFDNPYKS